MLHVTRMRWKMNGAFFRYLELSKEALRLKTPDHVEIPFASQKKWEAMDKENQKIILKDGRALGFAEHV